MRPDEASGGKAPGGAIAVGVTSPADPAGRLSPRLVIASIVGLWLCYFVLVSARSAVMGFPTDWPMVSRRVIVTAASMAVTALLWPVLHWLRHRELWIKAVAVMLAALPVALLLAAINARVFADIQAQSYSQLAKDRNINIRRDQAGNVLVDIGDPALPATVREAPDRKAGTVVSRSVIMIRAKENDETVWQQLTEVALGRYFILLAWAALYLALASAQQARIAERREGEYRRAAKAAELRSLRYQINPHFLFNTLNSLSALVLTGRADAAERMIQTLSTFYRRSLAEEPTADHTLAEEVELQGLYLDIEKVRFPDRLVTRFAIPDALKGCMVPGMILQPLVENSVKYAVAPNRREVTIAISAREEAGMLVVTVADDGPGLVDSVSGGTGIGLANVRDRLEARFGGEATIISGADKTGYSTQLRLPMVRAHG